MSALLQSSETKDGAAASAPSGQQGTDSTLRGSIQHREGESSVAPSAHFGRATESGDRLSRRLLAPKAAWNPSALSVCPGSPAIHLGWTVKSRKVSIAETNETKKTSR